MGVSLLEEGRFHKVCVICGNQYTSNARSQKYCGSECADKGSKKIKAIKVSEPITLKL